MSPMSSSWKRTRAIVLGCTGLAAAAVAALLALSPLPAEAADPPGRAASAARQYAPSDPAVRNLLPARGGRVGRADHDGEQCFSSGGATVKFGDGLETSCQDTKVGGREGRLCCPVSCTYACVGYAQGKPGQFKGTCTATGGACTFTPKAVGGPGGGGQGQVLTR